MDEHYRRLVERGDVTELIRSSQYGLQADSEGVVERAREALVKIGSPAIQPLVRAMNDFALEARMALAQQLNVEADWVTGDSMQRFAAAWRIDEEIQRLLKEGAPHPCMPAAITLALMGEKALQGLIDCLDEGRDWLVREAAALVLAHVGDKQAIPSLKKAVRFLGRDPVTAAARRAIRAIKRQRG